MRRVVLTALAALVLVAFTLSGCAKKTPETPKKPAGTVEKKAPAAQPKTETKAPAPAPAPAPTTPPAGGQATPAPAPAPTK